MDASGVHPEWRVGFEKGHAAGQAAYAALARELERVMHELEECRRTRALGGPPPPVDKNWANADVGRPSSADDPNAPAHRRDRSGGEPG